jgi:hypothetical protein
MIIAVIVGVTYFSISYRVKFQELVQNWIKVIQDDGEKKSKIIINVKESYNHV